MKVIRHVSEIQNYFGDIVSVLDVLREKQKKLEKAGIKYGSPSYKDGKYLRIVHPDQGGGRKFEYIGADQKKQAAVLACIDRGREFDSLGRKIREIERTIEMLSVNLQQISYGFESLCDNISKEIYHDQE